MAKDILAARMLHIADVPIIRSNSMAKNEKTSRTVGSIAAKGLKDPGSLSKKEIQRVCGTALTQRPDNPKPKR